MTLQRWRAAIDLIDGELMPTMIETDGDGYYLASEVDTLLTAATARADEFQREIKSLISNLPLSAIDLEKENFNLKEQLTAETARADEAEIVAGDLLVLLKIETARADAAARDAAFYKCCALSGEIPTEGAQPSAKEDKP